MRSNDGAASPDTLEAAQTPDITDISEKTGGRPQSILVAAIVLAAEAVALLVATVLNVIDIVSGQTYQVGNGVGLVILQVILIAGLLGLAISVASMRPWTRVPAVMVQGLIGIVAIVLLQAHRYDWGLPTLVLAGAGLAGLLHPASLRALARPGPETERGPEPETRQKQRQKQKPAMPQKPAASQKAVEPRKPAKPTSNAKTASSARSGNPAKRNPGTTSTTSTTSETNGKPVSRRS
jgi:hypothetical protein